MNKDLFKTKQSSGYSKDLLYTINVISGNKENNKVFGSASYPQARYPADVDTIETFTGCCSFDESIKQMVKLLKKVVKKISNEKYIFYSETKAGIDDAYFFPILFLLDDNINKEKLQKLKYLFDESYKEGLFTEEEIKNIYEMLSNAESNDRETKLAGYESLFNFLRSKYILRWTEKEMLDGYKMLPLNRKITLYQAISTYVTKVKIDTFAPVEGKYIEATNIFTFEVTNKKGATYPITVAHQDLILSLQVDIRNMLFHEYSYKPFKATKRMYSLARAYRDEKMTKKLLPLLNSDVGILYQIRSEIETIALLFKRVKNIPKDSIDLITNQIDNFKPRLSYVYTINYDYKKIFELIDLIVANINKYTVETIIEKIEEIMNILKPKIDNYAIKYLESNDLIPPPVEYLPEENIVTVYFPCKLSDDPFTNISELICTKI